MFWRFKPQANIKRIDTILELPLEKCHLYGAISS